MRRGPEYIPLEARFPFLGLDSFSPSTQGNVALSPDLLNIDIDSGIVKKRHGYRDLKIGAGATIEGIALGLIEFTSIVGTKTLVLITTTKRYKYDAANEYWTDITGATDWTGDETDGFDWTVGTDTTSKYLIITNNKDYLQSWNGTGNFSDFRPEIGAGPTIYLDRAKSIEAFYGRIVAGGFESGGNSFPTNVVWGVAGDFTDWLGVGSGSNFLVDSDGDIEKLLILGDRLAMHSVNSISLMTYLGSDFLFSFTKVVTNSNLVNPRSIISIPEGHVFLSTDNFYLFNGSSKLLRVGDLISNKLKNDLSLQAVEKVHGFYSPLEQKILWAIPRNSSNVSIYELSLGISEGVWTVQDFAQGSDRFSAFGIWSRDSAMTWDSSSLASKSWTDMVAGWDNTTFGEGTKVLVGGAKVTGGGTKGVIFESSELQDDGTDIIAGYVTKDFTVPSSFLSQVGRWMEVELDMRGTEVNINTSSDQGKSYQTAEANLTLTSDWTRYRIQLDIVSRTFRVSVASLDEHFECRWIRVWVKPGETD